MSSPDAKHPNQSAGTAERQGEPVALPQPATEPQAFKIHARHRDRLAVVYDPADPNDRLLLGLRGIISEVELHTMYNRLERGKLHKAGRGELHVAVPVGYVKTPTGEVALEPDEQARAVVQLVFGKFEE